jgi:hypothetical protein
MPKKTAALLGRIHKLSVHTVNNAGEDVLVLTSTPQMKPEQNVFDRAKRAFTAVANRWGDSRKTPFGGVRVKNVLIRGRRYAVVWGVTPQMQRFVNRVRQHMINAGQTAVTLPEIEIRARHLRGGTLVRQPAKPRPARR